MKITIQPLTHQNFEPFGDFISLQYAKSFKINHGSTDRFHALSTIDVTSQNGEPIVSVFRGQSFKLPFQLQVMERHPLGSQTFIPLNPVLDSEYLIVVAPANCTSEKEIIKNLKAFVARGFEGVTYRKGVWHHPLISLNQVNDFIVIDRFGEGVNCDEIAIASTILVDA